MNSPSVCKHLLCLQSFPAGQWSATNWRTGWSYSGYDETAPLWHGGPLQQETSQIQSDQWVKRHKTDHFCFVCSLKRVIGLFTFYLNSPSKTYWWYSMSWNVSSSKKCELKQHEAMLSISGYECDQCQTFRKLSSFGEFTPKEAAFSTSVKSSRKPFFPNSSSSIKCCI